MRDNKYNYNNQTGMFRNKILLRQRTVVTDELLQEIETFVDYGTYWAMVKTVQNKEVFESRQEQLNVQKRFVVKYAKSLDEFISVEKTSFELVHNGVTYDVKEAIDDNDLHETITIFCEVSM